MENFNEQINRDIYPDHGAYDINVPYLQSIEGIFFIIVHIFNDKECVHCRKIEPSIDQLISELFICGYL